MGQGSPFEIWGHTPDYRCYIMFQGDDGMVFEVRISVTEKILSCEEFRHYLKDQAKQKIFFDKLTKVSSFHLE